MNESYKDELGRRRSYEDIINLPHHVSAKHVPMSISERAAQFAPFSALTGYEEAINETIAENQRRMLAGNPQWEED